MKCPKCKRICDCGTADAPPKEVMRCSVCGKPFRECDGHSLAAHIEATAPPSDAKGFDSSGPWTAFSTVLYQGREYAMVMQRNRPWFCSRAGDNKPWVVEAIAPFSYEINEEMETAGMDAAKAERWIFTTDAALRVVIRKILRAALAAASKEG